MTIGKQSGHWQLNITGDSYATEGLEATRHPPRWLQRRRRLKTSKEGKDSRTGTGHERKELHRPQTGLGAVAGAVLIHCQDLLCQATALGCFVQSR